MTDGSALPAENSAPSVSESLSNLRELIELWFDGGSSIEIPIIDQALVSGLTIRALAEHAAAVTQAVLVLYGADMTLQSVPLTRLVVECGVTAAWLSVVPNAGFAASHANAKSRRALFESSPVFAEAVADARALVAEFAEHKSGAGEKFEQRCLQLVGGRDIYVSYRILSQASHAGVALADYYLRNVPVSEEATQGIVFDFPARDEGPEVTLAFHTCMLVLAMTACDNKTAGHPLDFRLQAIADRVGFGRHIAWVGDADELRASSTP